MNGGIQNYTSEALSSQFMDTLQSLFLREILLFTNFYIYRLRTIKMIEKSKELLHMKDLWFWVQSSAMPSIFHSQIAKKSTRHPLSG